MTRKTPFRDGGGPGPVITSDVAGTGTGPAVLLADLSEFQSNLADALYLAWSKAVVIRALYGDAHDDGAWNGGQRRALLHAGGARFLGVYQYLVAGQSGAAQARAFRSLVGAIRPGEVFIADFEEGNRGVLDEWRAEMLALYGQPVAPYLWTYTGLYFGEAQGVLPVEWIAAYGQAEPSTPHRLWQFTDAFQVPGVGSADCSIYHGTIEELAALAYQPSTPVPPPAPGPQPQPQPQPTTWEAIVANVPVISKGSTGQAVRNWQGLLIARGHMLAADGNFGLQTEAATLSTQRALGVAVDGSVGPVTWKAVLAG